MWRGMLLSLLPRLNCLPIANIEHFREEKMGRLDCVEEVSLGDGEDCEDYRVLRIWEGQRRLLLVGQSVGSDEAERSLHDALCVIRCLVTKKFLIAGGGACEIEMSRQLGAWAKVLHGMESYCVRSFAEALEVIPYTLAENAGLNPIAIVDRARTDMHSGEINTGSM
ncbi:hypothetical protein IFM89_021568 [Coptis chinensis]|uniref:T-complex protein 1 subunit delta n=1 Tax=Coptis chinensis TaxID=261450 RepID=A0A835I442_9MAGN|nr:hypothetical protein IFM89_021568 [Coptis chinensis]